MNIKGSIVFDGQVKIGNLRNFCCGVDFKPIKSQALFSLLHLKLHNHQEIIDCVQEIQQLPIDTLVGHYNWHHKDFVYHYGTQRPEFDEMAKKIK